MTEIDIADNFSRFEIDNQQFVPINAGMANTGVTVDRQVRGPAIPGGRDLVAPDINKAFIEHCYLCPGLWIHET